MTRFETRIVADGLLFPEAPRWRHGQLFFSDFHARRIAALSPETGVVETVAQLDDAPSGLGWRPDGVLQFVAMGGMTLNAIETDGISVFADLSSIARGRANDMVMTSDGSAYVGNFGFDMLAGAPLEATSLALVKPDGSVRAVGEGLLFPNGMVLIDDERTLVVAETYANRLSAFDVANDGSLSNQRVFAQFGPDVAPDGICADEDRAIWVATARGNRCVLVREGDGVVAETRVSDGNIAYACMLGGETGRDLFVCTAPSFRAVETRAARRGRIEVTRVDRGRAGKP